MDVSELKIQGCFLIKPSSFSDERGSFVKVFHDDVFGQHGVFFEPKEEFFSWSKKNVIRGLHFQRPPSQHNKLVYCPKGKVLDFFCDLRKSSVTYGQSMSLELSSDNNHVIYLPVGIAHGFFTLEDDSLMIYKTDMVYRPEDDLGIHWESANIDLGVESPIVSNRDKSFPSLLTFRSPFI